MTDPKVSLRLDIPGSTKDLIREAAYRAQCSMTEYVLRAVSERLIRDRKEWLSSKYGITAQELLGGDHNG